MKNLRLFCFPLLAALFILTAFRSSPTVAEREVRTVAAFTQLNLAGSFKVVLRQGNTQKVEVEADPEDLAHIETTVTNGKLRVGTKQENRTGFNWSSYNFKNPVTVYVTMPTVEALGVSGSGSMSAADPIRGDNLNLSVSGSGRLKLARVQADRLKSSVSGSGSISMSGNSAHHEVHISGSGQVDAPGLRSETCRASISGSGNCRVEVTKTLDASIAGSGNVYVTGKPQVNASTAGSGRVRSS